MRIRLLGFDDAIANGVMQSFLENDDDDVHLDHDLWPECVDIYRIHQSGVSEERLDWELTKNLAAIQIICEIFWPILPRPPSSPMWHLMVLYRNPLLPCNM